MSGPSAWDLIVASRFEEACDSADVEYATSKSLLPLRNKVLALLHLERYSEVVDLCQQLVEVRRGETDSDFIFAGIGYWFLGKKSAAVEQWLKAREAKYTDGAGGVQPVLLLLFAATRLADQVLNKKALGLLKQKARSKQVINWPGPLAIYMLGQITEEDLLGRVNAPPSLRARQICQARFYIAVRMLKDSDATGYLDSLRQSINQEPASRLEPEYYLAKGELAASAL